MQGGAMKQRSDANPAVFVWALIMLCFFSSICPWAVTSVTLAWKLAGMEMSVCLVCSAHLWQRGLLVGLCRPSKPLLVCVRVRMCVEEVTSAARRSAVNPAHLLICSLAWQRSSAAKAVSHKNQLLSQHITAAGISKRGQCPLLTYLRSPFTQSAPQECFYISSYLLFFLTTFLPSLLHGCTPTSSLLISLLLSIIP